MTIPPIITQREATNLIGNPVAADDTATWGKAASVTLNRITELPGTLPSDFPDGVTTGFHATIASTSTSTIDAGFTSVTLDAAVPHVGSVWVYLPPEWTGGDARARIANLAGASGGLTVTIPASAAGTWTRAVFGPFTPDANDLVGTFAVSNLIGTAWNEGEAIVFTAAMLHEGTSPLSFFVGTRSDRRLSGFMDLGSTHIGPFRVGGR